ncbi:probable thymidylate synthase isoform X2 [Macadamia integrifolia]|uniref:probable thymidylate synthase isoform X2 n=1 Tax=Macadamia integrifolia TaxID=60698 RepID=UPI001C4F38B4|nr:probable thymidylate synthase isoform X2 [Macadamia integrifolia]
MRVFQSFGSKILPLKVKGKAWLCEPSSLRISAIPSFPFVVKRIKGCLSFDAWSFKFLQFLVQLRFGEGEVMAHVKPIRAVPGKPRILLGASGSVAAIKFGSLCHSFSEWAEVRAVATKASLHFIDKASLPKDVLLHSDEDEWSSLKKIGGNVLHIELCKWADVMVIAPLSANTLGKIAGGLCDNLLTCIVRAWDFGKPLFVAPAMHTFMWNNSFTQQHLDSISKLGISLIPQITKRLACGDYGNGAMAELSVIYSTVRLSLPLESLAQATGVMASNHNMPKSHISAQAPFTNKEKAGLTQTKKTTGRVRHLPDESHVSAQAPFTNKEKAGLTQTKKTTGPVRHSPDESRISTQAPYTNKEKAGLMRTKKTTGHVRRSEDDSSSDDDMIIGASLLLINMLVEGSEKQGNTRTVHVRGTRSLPQKKKTKRGHKE